jgi:hypothetical protein
MILSTHRSSLLALAACCLFTAQPGSAQKLAQPGGVALSPDGTVVAWTLKAGDITTLHVTSAVDPDPSKEQLIAPVGAATDCSHLVAG